MSEVDAQLFAGTSHPQLAQAIASSSGIPLGEIRIGKFPDGETSVEVLESVRGKHLFVLQTIAHQPNEYLMELLIMVDALKRASAKEITAVIPYFGYCRQDRKDKPRVPITAKLVANLLTEAGITHLITMDLHAEQVQGFFDITVDHLTCRSLLIRAIQQEGFKGVVVGPDSGSIKIARAFGQELGVDFAIVDKHRMSPTEVGMQHLIGDVTGKDVLLADDMCSTGATLALAAKACHEKGAKRIIAAVTHGLIVDSAVDLIAKSPIDILYIADTIALSAQAKQLKKLRVVSVAGLFGQALQYTLSNKSIVSLLQTL